MSEQPSANLSPGVAITTAKESDPIPEFIMQASLPIALVSREGCRLAFANRRQLQIWQTTWPEVFRKPVWDIFGDEYRQQLEQLLTQVFAGSGIQHLNGVPWTIETSSCFFDISIEPVSDHAGKITHALMISVDVTDRTKGDDNSAEEMTQALEQKLSLVIENIPSTIYVFDKDLRIVHVNRSGVSNARGILGDDFDPSEPLVELMRKASERVDYTDENDQPINPELYPTYVAKKFGREADLTVKRKHRKTGEVVWMLIRAIPMFARDGQVENIISISSDLTAQRKAEEKISQSQEQLRLITNSLPALISYVDKNEVYQYGNDRYREWFGFPAEKIIGMTLLEVLGKEAYRKLEPYFRKVLAGEPVSFESLVPYHRGGHRYILANYVPHIGPRNEVLGFYALVSDITERKAVENEVLYRKALLEAQNDAIPDAILVVDTRGAMVSMNQQYIDLWHMPADIIESGAEDAALAYSEKLLLDPESFRKKIAYYYSHVSEEVHDELKFLDGRIVERYGKAVIGQDGTNYGWIWYFRDITEMKHNEQSLIESENRFRTLAETLPQMVWAADGHGEIEYYSEQWHKYSGRKDITDAWTWMVHPRDVRMVEEVRTEGFRSGIPFRAEVRLRNAAGEYRWHSGVAEPVKDKDGKLVKWVGAFTDIHDQKTLAEKLESLVEDRTRELHRSNEDLLQFAHVASHDLKEPIRKMLTFGGRLRKEYGGNLPGRAGEYLSKMERAAERMFSMVEGVLKYSSMSATEERFEIVDLNRVIDEIEADLEVLFRQKNAALKKADLPRVQGSKILLYQLFYNLINNSLKFSRAGVVPLITMQTGPVLPEEMEPLGLPPGGTFVKIIVEDNGIGFAPDEAERIFSSFTRLNPKDQYEGTGLGLSLCRKIAERHGGTIYAAGEEGKGARFTVLLPG